MEIGIKSIYKKNGKVSSLSEKEIEELCNNSFSGILNNTVEDLGEEVFNSTFLKNDEDFINSLYGEDRRQRKYLCSIYGGQSHLVNDFEAYLAGKRGGKKIPEENIRRIGLLGFWHYFIECKPKHLIFLKKNVMMLKREKVIDVIEQNRSPFCSITSSLRQIK